VLLRRTLGLRIPFYITRNVSPPYEASDRAVQLVRERNELDLELYRFARELFAAQLSRQDRSFGLEASAYRALQPLSRAAGRNEEVLRTLYRAASGRKRKRSDPSWKASAGVHQEMTVRRRSLKL
jgi:hypothetical protein